MNTSASPETPNPLTSYREKFGPEPNGLFKYVAGFKMQGPELMADMQKAVDSGQPIDWATYRPELWGRASGSVKHSSDNLYGAE